MPEVYRASDVFVAGSLWESSGRALVEALAQGLPCLTHAYPVMSWIGGEHAVTGDLRRRGALAALLEGIGDHDFAPEVRRARHDVVYERFSWDRLAPAYVELLRSCALSERGPQASELPPAVSAAGR
jgi:glycosyltransferase involved in cell wall biosynthesis